MTASIPKLADLTPLQRSVMAINALRERLNAVEGERTAPIAVVGIGCRFPRAHGPAAFFDALMAGTDAVGPVPAERWALRPGDPAHLGSGAFLDDVDRFDAGYFGISPREAAVTDPQQRLLLETAIETLEDAGLAPDRLTDSPTGIFIGAMTSDYAQIAADAELEPHVVSGIGNCFLAGRLAHSLGTRGPALSVDTACSSSLVAIHLAVQALRSGECELAVAGGVNLMLTPIVSRIENAAQMLSPGARCRTFAAGADGIVRGEGVGLVALMRLPDAVARGLRVQAVIRGSAVVHDGASAGLTVPSEAAQRLVIERALAQSALAASDIAYLEAHGTGTALGDPIELAAACAALRPGADAARTLVIGSVKTNLGHLEAAAGIAAFIKTVLALSRGAIPPHLHFNAPNPLVPWDEVALRVPTSAMAWPDGAAVRAAGVSSFGLSGTNAHLIVTSPHSAVQSDTAARYFPHVFTLSAQSGKALREAAGRWARRLAKDPAVALDDVCRTANEGRAALDERLAGRVEDLAALTAALADFAAGGSGAPLRAMRSPNKPPPLAVRPSGDPDGTARLVASVTQSGQAPILLDADEIVPEGMLVLSSGAPDLPDQLAEMWLRGVSINWVPLYRDSGARLIAMPTYPFERQRHWVKTPSPVASVAPNLPPQVPSPAKADGFDGMLRLVEQLGEAGAAERLSEGHAERLARLGPAQQRLLAQLAASTAPVPPPEPQAGAATLLHDIVWRPVAIPAEAQPLTGRWLVLGAPSQAMQPVAAGLARAGAEVATGDIDACSAGMDSALACLNAASRGPNDPLHGIVLLVLEAGAPDSLPLALFHLARAFDGVGAAPARLAVVTTGAQAVLPGEAPDPTHAAVWGLAGTVANEYPGMRVTRVDLGRAAPVPDLAALLASETEPQIALRGGKFLAPRLVRRATPAGNAFAARADATYLVTGGLGALGLEVARWLADRGARHLVLVGREQRGLEAIAQLLAAGVDVTVSNTDVADPAAMTALFAHLTEGSPPLRGVIHAAGVLSDGILRQQNRDSFARVMRPKLAGARVLDDLTRDLALDFFVAFSSLAETIGSPGQGNYVAANAALGACMAARRAKGLPGIALRWGPWAQAGMAAAASERDRARITALGIRPMTVELGLAQLEAVLAGPADRDPVIVDADWSTFAAHPAAARLSHLLGELGAAVPAAGAPAAPVATAPAPTDWAERIACAATGEHPALLRALTHEAVAQTLGMAVDELDPTKSLLRLGFDSLMAIALKELLLQQLSVEIDLTQILDGATTLDIADTLLAQLEAGDKPALPLAEAPACDEASPDDPIDAARARDLLSRLDELDETERERLLDQMLGEV